VRHHPRQTSTVPEPSEPPERPAPNTAREAVQRWRLVLARGPLDADSGQREQLAAWERALADSGLPVAGLDAIPPRPRFAVAAPLSASIPGEAELVDVWLVERVPAWRVREALGPTMPPAHRLVEAYDVWPGAPALPGQVAASVYRAHARREDVDPAALAAACEGLLGSATIERERAKGGGTVRYDLRPFIEALAVDAGDDAADGVGSPEMVTLHMTLRHDPERGIGRPDEVLAAIAERMGAAPTVTALVRERLVLAPPPAPAPPAQRPRGPRRGGQPATPPSRPRK
jgi:radical SAM-linked protein